MRGSAFRLAFLALLLFSSPASAQLATVETPAVRLVYFEGTESYLVPHVGRAFFNAFTFEKKLFDYEPKDPITVLLADFQDNGNASAGSVPRNLMAFQIAPLNFSFETIAANERMSTLMNHELVHVVTMDQAAGRDRMFRTLFGGKVTPIAAHPESLLYWYLTAPRTAAPRWYHEGIAVFVDTWMAGGLGRAQGGYDEMVFRAMVRDDVPFYDPLGLASEGTKIDFQTQVNSYLYGTRFMTWLARRYSPEQVIAWTARRSGSRAYYSAQFRQVFGRSMEDAWADWIADEHVFQRKNLEEVRKYPLTQTRDLRSEPLGSVSRAFFDSQSGSIFAGVNYPGAVANVARIDGTSGRLERLVNIKGPVIYAVTSLVWNSSDRHIYYTTDNGAHRDLVRLDPETHRTEELQKDARIGDLAYSAADNTIWGLRSLNGLTTLVRMKAPYKDWERLVTFPYGTVMYDIDVSADGTRVSGSFGEISGQQDVRVFATETLVRGDTTPLLRFDFGQSVPNGFTFSPDGKYLYGSSYYTGVSNIFRYDLDAKKIEGITNTDTGLFRPVPLADGRLLAFRYTGRGFVPTWIDPKPIDDVNPITFFGKTLIDEKPVLSTWMLDSPAKIPFESMDQHKGEYHLAGGMRRESIYPVVEGYKDTGAVGVAVNYSDPLMLNRLQASLSVSPFTDLPSGERLHASARYERYDWRGEAAYNGASFYDLFGPTKTGRKGYRALVGHKNTLIYDEPRRLELDVSGSIAGNIDRLPDYQNVAVDVNTLGMMRAELSFTDVRKSLGWVDDEVGAKWSVEARGDIVGGEAFPKLRAGYDRGVAVPLGHSSIWLRSAAGFSPRDRANPFANFFFGGFGNNWVDSADEKRYRHFDSFPGLELNEIGGRNFARTMAEWNLPPLRFSRLGTPGFYATWLRPALFATVIGTDLDAGNVRRTVTSLGAQADLRFTVLSNQDMTLSFGAGVALEKDRPARREAMVSLKILK
jgi:hypothetical protein